MCIPGMSQLTSDTSPNVSVGLPDLLPGILLLAAEHLHDEATDLPALARPYALGWVSAAGAISEGKLHEPQRLGL